MAAALLAAGLGIEVDGACANPQGGTVKAGSATISSTPGKTEINQSSDRVIIDWQGFSIGANEITRFNQPSSKAAALNRVTGADPSQILGQLQANGKILLINPNGILFGAGSKVDVAGLVATTANISNDDFMAKRLSFSTPGNPGAAVVNRGTITVAEGGLVALVAPGVANEGVINARLGRVSLVAANRFTVDFHGDRLIQFAVDDKVMQQAVAADGTPLAAAVSNSGRIAADGGVVQMSANVARGVVDRAIDMSGKIEARAIRQVGGKVVLDGGDTGTVQVAGTIDASGRGAGQTGGRIEILGKRVGLFAGSTLDASGDTGGGTVLVGGARLGQGPQRNAEAAYVDQAATIKADAITKGTGGEVVVWSDKYTRFDGTISARGGAQGGDGGKVETSSKEILSANGAVDAAAPAGKAGEWLLDPWNVTITGATANGAFGGGNPDTYTPTNTGATVNAATISASLTAGTSVIISTGSTGTENGDVTLASSITKTGATNSTLTINAAGSMSVTGGSTISATGGAALDVSITVPNAGTLPGMSLGTGNLTVTSDGGHLDAVNAISAKNVSITMSSPHGLDMNNASNAITGTVTLTNLAGSGNDIVNSVALKLGTVSLTGSNTSTFTAPSITQTGALSATGGTTSLVSTTGAIDVTNAGNSIDGILRLTTPTGQDASVVNTIATQFGATTVRGNLTFNGSGAITQNGSGITVSGTSSFKTGSSTITLTDNNNAFTGAVSFTNTGTNAVSLRNSTSLALGASSTGGALTLDVDGSISQTGALTVTGLTSIRARSANTDVTLNTQANDLAGGVTFTNALGNFRDVAIRNTNATVTAPDVSGLTNLRNYTLRHDSAAVALGALDASGNLSVTAGGAITQTAAATVAGTSSFSTGAFAITLTQAANSFTGAVGLTNTGTNNASLTNNRATVLAASTIGRNLTVSAAGAVTQTGALTVGGTTSVSAGANAITLTQAANSFSGAVSLSNSGGGNATSLTTNSALQLGTVAVGGNLTVTASAGTSLASSISTAGAISFSGSLALGGSVGLTGSGITLGAVTGGGQTLTLNAGSSGNISLGSVGTSGTPLGALTITNARNVTSTSLISVSSLTQSAGTGTTSFSGSGVSASGAVSLTTAAIDGVYNVGSFTVTSGQTVATGSIGGVGGVAAAASASSPGSTGTQTFNGCTIGTTCTVSTPTPTPTPAPTSTASTPIVSLTEAAAVSAVVAQIAGAASRQPAPSGDGNNSNVNGFVVQLPTQNVEWSNPSGDLRVNLSPEFAPLRGFFHGGSSSR